MSEVKESFFKKIDTAIFKQIDQLKNDPNFSKMSDLFTTLSEQESRILQQVMAFGVILLPYLVVAFLFWGNYQTKKTLQLKKQVLDEFEILSSNRNNLLAQGPSLLAPSSLQGQSDLENRVRNVLSSNSIDQSKVSVTSFDVGMSSSTFTKSTSLIQFNKFGTQDFNMLLRNLIEMEKFKVSRVKLKKDVENDLLLGEIELLHLGRNSAEGY